MYAIEAYLFAFLRIDPFGFLWALVVFVFKSRLFKFVQLKKKRKLKKKQQKMRKQKSSDFGDF